MPINTNYLSSLQTKYFLCWIIQFKILKFSLDFSLSKCSHTMGFYGSNFYDIQVNKISMHFKIIYNFFDRTFAVCQTLLSDSRFYFCHCNRRVSTYSWYVLRCHCVLCTFFVLFNETTKLSIFSCSFIPMEFKHTNSFSWSVVLFVIKLWARI